MIAVEESVTREARMNERPGRAAIQGGPFVAAFSPAAKSSATIHSHESPLTTSQTWPYEAILGRTNANVSAITATETAIIAQRFQPVRFFFRASSSWTRTSSSSGCCESAALISGADTA